MIESGGLTSRKLYSSKVRGQVRPTIVSAVISPIRIMWVILNFRFLVQFHSNLQPIGMNTKPAVMQLAKARCISIIKSASKSDNPKKFLEHKKKV